MSTQVPALLAVAHGTHDRAGIAVIEELADLVRGELPEVDVRLCYVDVASPSLAEALAGLDRPAVLVPLLLSTGYHVRTDIPGLVGSRSDVVITDPIGPDQRISAAALSRLAEAVGAPDAASSTDELMVVSAGSSDPDARRELAVVAGQVQTASGRRVRAVRFAQLTDADPFGGVPVTTPVISYLLAPGYFANKLAQLAAPRPVGAPIGAHPLVVEVIAERYRTAAGRPR